METEIKLSFESKEKLYSIIDEEWFIHLCLDASKKPSVKLENTYFDTVDRKLANRGGSIRVRLYVDEEDNERYEHTVKYGGKVANGLYQRYEWNVDAENDQFDINKFKKSAMDEDDPNELLEEFLSDVNSDEIVPICTTSFSRITYTVGFGDSMMEACFDLGFIKAGDKTMDICEMELELISGDVVDLKDLGDYIADNSGAVFFNDSKFKRGRMLLDEE